jgi:hypothetical protein
LAHDLAQRALHRERLNQQQGAVGEESVTRARACVATTAAAPA